MRTAAHHGSHRSCTASLTLCAYCTVQASSARLAYQAGIFSHLNDLNSSIQGPNKTILDAGEKLKFFLEKLPLWMRQVEISNLANFPQLEEALQGRGNNLLQLRTKYCFIWPPSRCPSPTTFAQKSCRARPGSRILFL